MSLLLLACKVFFFFLIQYFCQDCGKVALNFVLRLQYNCSPRQSS